MEIEQAKKNLSNLLKELYSRGISTNANIEKTDKELKLYILLYELLSVDNFVLTTHKKPDPDGLGSEIGLYYLLNSFGKKVIIVNPDKTPDKYAFIDQDSMIFNMENNKPRKIDSDCNVVMLDNSALERIGDVENYLNKKRSNLIVIDHHNELEDFKGLFSFPYIGSTSEIIYELIELAGLSLNYNVAVAIYLGILMDTGQFKYNKTRPRTHEITAELLKLKLPTEDLSRKLFENYPLSVLELKKDIYNSLTIIDSKIVTIEIPFSVLQKYKFFANPIDGVISEFLSPKEILVSVSFTGTDSGQTKLSLRSKGNINICNIAKKYKGGGHTNASGATVDEPIESIKKKVILDIQELLKNG